MIKEYKFGSITINDETFDHDVEVRWTPRESPHGVPAGQAGEVLKWWRKEGHVIDAEDLERAISQDPEIIVIGTGAYGAAQVTDRAKEVVKNKGIELIVDNTEQAVKTFDIQLQESEGEEGEPKKVIGLFHLTC